MSALSTSERNALSDKVFGSPRRRTYPMPDASHAGNAKARAVEEFKGRSVGGRKGSDRP
jgi:hypothetical protein